MGAAANPFMNVFMNGFDGANCFFSEHAAKSAARADLKPPLTQLERHLGNAAAEQNSPGGLALGLGGGSAPGGALGRDAISAAFYGAAAKKLDVDDRHVPFFPGLALDHQLDHFMQQRRALEQSQAHTQSPHQHQHQPHAMFAATGSFRATPSALNNNLPASSGAPPPASAAPPHMHMALSGHDLCGFHAGVLQQFPASAAAETPYALAASASAPMMAPFGPLVNPQFPFPPDLASALRQQLLQQQCHHSDAGTACASGTCH